MRLLILGLAIFLAVHLIPSFVSFRKKLIVKLGDMAYIISYSVLAICGLVLIIVGKTTATMVRIWDPPFFVYWINPVLMLFAIVSFIGAYIPSNLNRFVKHPFLWGVTLWALSHLLVNGDLSSILLFGGFGTFALFDMWSSNRRIAMKPVSRHPWRRDLLLVMIGLIIYLGLIFVHPHIFGVPAIATI